MALTTRHMLVPAIAVSVLLSACGGSGSEDEQLVSVKAQMDLDFRIDPNDGPEHAFSIETEQILDRDGYGTYNTGEEVREFEASPEQLSEVEEAFDVLDMNRLAEDFDAETDEVGSFTVTYDGETTEIGANVVDDGTGGGEGDEQFITAILTLGELSESEDSPAESRVERDRQKLTGCLETKNPPLCFMK